MDIDEVIGTNKNSISVSDSNSSQDNGNESKINKENEKIENRDRMILIDGIMQYVEKNKERIIDESINNFRFKGDHKESIILIASVREEKLVKDKVGNAVRIATKIMAILAIIE